MHEYQEELYKYKEEFCLFGAPASMSWISNCKFSTKTYPS